MITFKRVEVKNRFDLFSRPGQIYFLLIEPGLVFGNKVKRVIHSFKKVLKLDIVLTLLKLDIVL